MKLEALRELRGFRDFSVTFREVWLLPVLLILFFQLRKILPG